MKNKIYTEECICCHGTGKKQQFDEKQNKWVKSDLTCDVCNGKGIREYIDITQSLDWIYKRLYL